MTPPFTLRQLEIFRSVLETGTISAAAQALHTAQSSVSAAINELEKQVGQQLLIRRKAQGTWPTTAGRQLYRDAVELLKMAEEAARHLEERDGKIRGLISIGIFATLPPYVGPLMLTEFRSRHPLIKLEFHEEDHDELITKLHEGIYDVALSYLEPKPPSEELAQQEITTRATHVLMSARHRLAQYEFVTLKDIEQEPLILLGHTPSRDNTLRLLGLEINDPRIAWVTSSIPLTRALVGHGLGVSLLVQPDASVKTADGIELTQVPLHAEKSTAYLGVIWRKPAHHRRPPRRITSLVQFCTEEIGSHIDAIGNDFA